MIFIWWALWIFYLLFSSPVLPVSMFPSIKVEHWLTRFYYWQWPDIMTVARHGDTWRTNPSGCWNSYNIYWIVLLFNVYLCLMSGPQWCLDSFHGELQPSFKTVLFHAVCATVATVAGCYSTYCMSQRLQAGLTYFVLIFKIWANINFPQLVFAYNKIFNHLPAWRPVASPIKIIIFHSSPDQQLNLFYRF